MSILPLQLLVWLIAHGMHIVGMLLLELCRRSIDVPRVTVRDMAHLEHAVKDMTHAHKCIDAFAGTGPAVEGVRWVR